MSYRQLTQEERYQIQTLRGIGATQAQIARVLDRSPSTISREIRRNGHEHEERYAWVYRAVQAQSRTQRRRIAKGARCRKLAGALAKLVEGKLALGWSPEQISGRLKLEQGIRISHEAIYQHIIRDNAKPSSQRKGLRYTLRFHGYTHRRFKRSKMAERTRVRRNWLKSRPAAANDRTEIGHWERDMLVGKRGGAALLTMTDRRSRYALVRYVGRINNKRVAAATVDALALHRQVSKTLTNDNGVEFQRDLELSAKLNVPIYYTDPGKPWQRGSIENMNGLIRQYLAKGVSLDHLPRWVPRALEETLNFRPRKVLGWRTPHEVFYGKDVELTRGDKLRFGFEITSVN